MKTITIISVDGTIIAMNHHYGQDHLTIMKEKSVDQGKKKENMPTQETVWEL